MSTSSFKKTNSGKYRYVWDAWLQHRRSSPNSVAIIHWEFDREPTRITWGTLLDRAEFYSRVFFDAGVRSGDVCGIMVQHTPEFHSLYMGICAIGAVPSVLAWPNSRIHPTKFVDGLRGMARSSGMKWMITQSEFVEKIKPLIYEKDSTIVGTILPFENGVSNTHDVLEEFWKEVDPKSTFLLQHSSGTTGLQKAVALSHEAVLAQLENYGEAIALSLTDKVVSWLPLYHDMGLIAAMHLPLFMGIPIIQLSPFDWVQAPIMLLEAIHKEKATLTWMPNFGFSLLADRVNIEEASSYNLGSLRMLISCSEPVMAGTMDKFITRFAHLGLRRTSLSACYAMAETTFAITQTPPNSEPERIIVDRQEFAKGIISVLKSGEGREFVSSGRPLAGSTVVATDPYGVQLPEGCIGELRVKSCSSFSGYRGKSKSSAKVFRDGYYSTNDRGFILDGNVYVVGRMDDLIIVAGKNLYPQDIEAAANNAEGVIPGRVVAFGAENSELGTSRVCIIAESKDVDKNRKDLIATLIKTKVGEIDVTASDVFIVPPRWLIKSSSGKLSRQANKKRLMEWLEEQGDGNDLETAKNCRSA